MPYTHSVRLPKRTLDALKSQLEQERGGIGARTSISKAACEAMLAFASNPSEVVNALSRKAAKGRLVGPFKPLTQQTSITADPELIQRFIATAHLFDYSFDTLLKIALEDRITR